MNEIALIKGLPISKQGVIDIAHAIVEDVVENGANPLDYEPILKVLEDIRKEVKGNKRYLDVLEMETNKYSGEGKSFLYKGVKFTVQNRRTYDFSVCEDETYQSLLEQKAELDRRVKEREAFLKTLKEPVADTNYGNTIYPPATKSKTVVAVTL